VAGTSSAPSPRAEAPARGATACRLVRGTAELGAHLAIRRQIFVEAQGLFAQDDRDERDRMLGTLHVLGFADGHPAGAVRLYPLDDAGLWKGDRLAVLPADRAHHVGAMLVRFAVQAAAERGGSRMLAQIQLPNVRFFERLGWRRDGVTAPLHGLEHQPMAIELSPRADAAP
jgi:putative N-acetyltransferase (TIGR04045 family)